jgi:hypothetical protein
MNVLSVAVPWVQLQRLPAAHTKRDARVPSGGATRRLPGALQAPGGRFRSSNYFPYLK